MALGVFTAWVIYFRFRSLVVMMDPHEAVNPTCVLEVSSDLTARVDASWEGTVEVRVEL